MKCLHLPVKDTQKPLIKLMKLIFAHLLPTWWKVQLRRLPNCLHPSFKYLYLRLLRFYCWNLSTTNKFQPCSTILLLQPLHFSLHTFSLKVRQFKHWLLHQMNHFRNILPSINRNYLHFLIRQLLETNNCYHRILAYFSRMYRFSIWTTIWWCVCTHISNKHTDSQKLVIKPSNRTQMEIYSDDFHVLMVRSKMTQLENIKIQSKCVVKPNGNHRDCCLLKNLSGYDFLVTNTAAFRNYTGKSVCFTIINRTVIPLWNNELSRER